MLKNGVFWDVTPCGSCEKRSVYIIWVKRIGELETLGVTGNVSSSTILVILIMEELSSSETLVLRRASRLNIREDDILHSHRREIHLKSYNG
jgi:hypothetical protein